MIDLRSSSSIDPQESLWAAGCLALVFITMHQALYWYRRLALRLAERAEAQAQARPLTPGLAVLSGKVEVSREQPHALRVEVVQHGKESPSGRNKGSRWRETARRVDACVFYLVCDDGERVRVEPDEKVVFIAKLDETIRDSTTVRRRVATLRSGQRVSVEGALSRAEDAGAGRDGSPGRAPWVLRPHQGKMLVSSEGPGAAHRARAKRASLVFVVIFAVLASPALLGYAARAVLGEDTAAHVTARRSFTTSYKNRTSHIYEVTFETASGMTVTDHVEPRDWDSVREGAEIPVREVPFSSGLTYIGHGASLSLPMTIFAMVLALLAFGGSLMVFWERPWYEKRLHETERDGL